MQHKIFLFLVILVFTACKSKPLPDQNGPAEALSLPAPVTSETSAPSSDKAQIASRLLEIQRTVYAIEDRIYGTKKLGNLGLYGELKSCRRKLASRQFGGNGNLIWSESLDRLTDKEEEVKEGGDGDRLQRFEAYRMILQRRADDYSARGEACKAELAVKERDTSQPSRVMVAEVPKTSVERVEINRFLCDYAKVGASLKVFMQEAFARGWLALADYRMSQNLIAVSLKDVKGSSRDHALLFNGWKLAFDRSPITFGDLFSDAKEARLVAWAFDRKADIPESSACLSAPDGQWNP